MVKQITVCLYCNSNISKSCKIKPGNTRNLGGGKFLQKGNQRKHQIYPPSFNSVPQRQLYLLQRPLFFFIPCKFLSLSVNLSGSAVVCQLIMSHLSGGLKRGKYDSERAFHMSVSWGLGGGWLMRKQLRIIYSFSCKLFSLNKLDIFFERRKSNSYLSNCRFSISIREHL